MDLKEEWLFLACSVFGWVKIVCVMKMHNKKFPLTPSHPNISMHILHTVPYTFPEVLTRRICLNIKLELIL